MPDSRLQAQCSLQSPWSYQRALGLQRAYRTSQRLISSTGGRMTKRPKVELVPVEADSDTQRVLERLIKTLEKQGFKIIRKDKK